MADQIVITEKTSQAKDIRTAVGSRYGDILPAEGHLLDLLEPEDVVPAWKRWSPILLRPEGLYGTRPAEGRPDLQPVADPNRNRYSGPRSQGRDRGWPGEDADLGNRVQARAGNPELRAGGLF